MNRPQLTPGQRLHLAYDHWKYGLKVGSPVIFVKTRKDIRCKSGFRIYIKTIPTPEFCMESIEALDANWFKELTETRREI